MKSFSKIAILITFLFLNTYSQDNFYWNKAPVTGTKIYHIAFLNNQEGTATSNSGELLITTNGGENWNLITSVKKFVNSNDYLWSADIYCSIMHTIDGGITWQPYLQEKQEHFCNVYFNDKNTGWKVAEEFLNKVAKNINNYLEKNKIDALLDQPHQCTEYYTDMDSGWALGWCVKNFNQ